jgi:hypothetical protein
LMGMGLMAMPTANGRISSITEPNTDVPPAFSERRRLCSLTQTDAGSASPH